MKSSKITWRDSSLARNDGRDDVLKQNPSFVWHSTVRHYPADSGFWRDPAKVLRRRETFPTKWARSKVVLHGIRIAKAGVRFSPGPPFDYSCTVTAVVECPEANRGAHSFLSLTAHGGPYQLQLYCYRCSRMSRGQSPFDPTQGDPEPSRMGRGAYSFSFPHCSLKDPEPSRRVMAGHNISINHS